MPQKRAWPHGRLVQTPKEFIVKSLRASLASDRSRRSGRTSGLMESRVCESVPRKIGQHFVLPQYDLSTVLAQAPDYGRRAARTGQMHSVDEINACLT